MKEHSHYVAECSRGENDALRYDRMSHPPMHPQAAPSQPPPGISLGLTRIVSLLEHLSNPQSTFPVIQIAGTNGKGSVSALVSAILCASLSTNPSTPSRSLSVGRFNSPHLISPRDCIRLNDKVIDEETYAETLKRVKEADAARRCQCTSFEILTAVAFVAFADAGVDLVVLEVGVGGRGDATSACDPPVVSVLTAVGMDHVALLGGSLDSIAEEKVGIVRTGVKAAVLGLQDETSVVDVFDRVVQEVGCPVFRVDGPVTSVSDDGTIETSFRGEGVRARLGLLGAFQLGNVATALRAVEALCEVDPAFVVQASAVCKALPTVRWPGRLEYLTLEGRKVLVDGAHNEPAARALGKFTRPLRDGQRGITWIMALTAGKDASGIFRHLLEDGDVVYTTDFSQPEDMGWIHATPPSELRLSVDAVARTTQWTVPGGVMACLQHMSQLNQNLEQSCVVVCGSLYLIADLYRQNQLPI
ncbi:folylpolyglutamate synthase [Thoreauomyces humboldtii]|nr:folylpolyglutamate synthase [Thoreauomyces humboldtii]